MKVFSSLLENGGGGGRRRAVHVAVRTLVLCHYLLRKLILHLEAGTIPVLDYMPVNTSRFVISCL
jgi:hypothetical protein